MALPKSKPSAMLPPSPSSNPQTHNIPPPHFFRSPSPLQHSPPSFSSSSLPSSPSLDHPSPPQTHQQPTLAERLRSISKLSSFFLTSSDLVANLGDLLRPCEQSASFSVTSAEMEANLGDLLRLWEAPTVPAACACRVHVESGEIGGDWTCRFSSRFFFGIGIVVLLGMETGRPSETGLVGEASAGAAIAAGVASGGDFLLGHWRFVRV